MSFKVIGCIGDSIANGYWCNRGLGWFGRLQEKIATQYPLQFGFNNMAMSGDRSIDALHRIGAEALHRELDILIIAVGVNDLIRWEHEDGVTDQSPQARHETWHRMLQMAKTNFKQVLVVELIPSNEDKYPCTGYDGVTPMWHKAEDTLAYNKDIATWCATFDIPVCQTYNAFWQADHKKMLHDGGHPNGKGHEFIANIVLEKLESLNWLTVEDI